MCIKDELFIKMEYHNQKLSKYRHSQFSEQLNRQLLTNSFFSISLYTVWGGGIQTVLDWEFIQLN